MNHLRVMLTVIWVCVLSACGNCADCAVGEILDLASVTGAFPKDFVPAHHAQSSDCFLFVAGEK
jgi:hypothetical protein